MKSSMETEVKSKDRILIVGIFVIIFTCLIPQGEPFAQSVNFLYANTGFAPGSAYSRPLGICFDKQKKECYIADTGNHQVVICDENGMPVYRFPHYTIGRDGESVLGEPKSIAVDSKGRIFLTDATARYLDILDYRGVLIKRIHPSLSTERFDYLALGPGDKVYATVSGEGKKILVINGDLLKEKEFNLDHVREEHSFISSIAVDKEGKIYVADPGAGVMIQIFDEEGNYLRGFGYHDTGYENFSFPSGLVVMDDGSIWIADAIRQIVSCFSSEGEFRFFLGGKGIGAGDFNYPSAIASDGKNRLFVLERVGRRYQCFELMTSENLLREEKKDFASDLRLTKGGEKQ